MNRRRFLASAAAAAALSGCRRSGPPSITGRIVGAPHNIGHLLREGSIPAVSHEERAPIVIVGGGMAGLSAGWRLERRGFTDFRIFELDDKPGGNSRGDANAVSAYPWGAHYVPLPTKESVWVRELLEELGVITGHDASGDPVFEERYLCAAPQERLFIHGRWQEGLLPLTGATRKDHHEFDRFRKLIEAYKERRDARQRKAFAIPMELSSPEVNLLDLDRLSIADFLRQEGFESEPLHWYVDYACRDDFGALHTAVSAWAGMHYFASRDASEDENVLTWPQGNGWIVERLEEVLKQRITTSSLVYRIEQDGSRATVDVYNTHEQRSTRVIADRVIFACPSFLARHVVSGLSDRLEALDQFEYAPWLVANLTLGELPAVRSGVPLAWDNVIYDNPSLGYVVATHQALSTHPRETVLTYYRALAGASPAEDRKRLLEMSWQDCVEMILADLAKPHPEMRDIVRNIDVMKWGHAMIRPRPGFLWGSARQQMSKPLGRIHFANSDLSGFSIFEEAQYRGVTAADAALAKL